MHKNSIELWLKPMVFNLFYVVTPINKVGDWEPIIGPAPPGTLSADSLLPPLPTLLTPSQQCSMYIKEHIKRHGTIEAILAQFLRN